MQRYDDIPLYRISTCKIRFLKKGHSLLALSGRHEGMYANLRLPLLLAIKTACVRWNPRRLKTIRDLLHVLSASLSLAMDTPDE